MSTDSTGPTPPDDPQDEVVYHQMTIATGERDALQEHLKKSGVASAVHYPSALHRQPAMAGSPDGDLPRAEQAAREVLCLPMFPELDATEVERAAAAVAEFYGN